MEKIYYFIVQHQIIIMSICAIGACTSFTLSAIYRRKANKEMEKIPQRIKQIFKKSGVK